MTYKVGTRSEAQAIADSLNANDPDHTYSADIHEFNQDWHTGESTEPFELNVWGVVMSDHGFLWNARSLAAWLTEHPIRIIT
jgi:hypothetical protein